MKLTIKLASAAGAVGLATVGTLAALGSSPAAAHARAAAPPAAIVRIANVSKLAPKALIASPPAAVDTDSIQSGDQTTPDTPAPASVTTPGDETATPETGAPSDGPGGHQDTGTNVDHQFDGTE